MATASPKSKFDAAVKVIHSLPKDGPFQPSREMMLLFYGYYKQATEGPCKSPKPGFWDLVKKAKWEAWSKLGDMKPETAMVKYVDELKKTLKDCTKQWDDMSKNGDPRIVEAMPQTQVVGDFMEVLGNFYEIVDEDSPMKTRRVPNGDISENHVGDGDEEVIVEESIKGKVNTVQSSDSEEEFCDTSADLEILSVNKHSNNLVQSTATTKSTKANKVRFSDTNGIDTPYRETVHVAQGFPFISSNNMNGDEDILVETNNPLSSTVSASKYNSDLSTEISLSNISANNSNVIGVADEGEEPPEGGDKGQQRNTKSSQGSSRRSGTSRSNLQGTGGRRALLPGGGAGGGAGGGGGSGQQNPGTSGDVNEQITTMLVRLQQDMTNVLNRLNKLEENSKKRQKNESTWVSSIFNRGPFANRTGRAAFFILIWPVIVHLALSYFFRRRRKR